MAFMASIGRHATVVALLALGARHNAGAQRQNQYGYPEKLAPRATTSAITAADLMTRLYIFADDSMQGRNSPLESNARSNAYIVRELTRMKLAPAGALGSYYQVLPYVQRTISPRTMLAVDGMPLTLGTDFGVTSRGMPRIVDSTQVIYAGMADNPERMIPAEWAANRFVIVTPAPPPPQTAQGAQVAGGRGAGGAGGGRGGRGGAGQAGQPVNVLQRYANAAAIAMIVPSVQGAAGAAVSPAGPGGFGGRGAGPVLQDPSAQRVAAQFQITSQAAARLLGRPVENAGPGTLGGLTSAVIVFDDTPIPHAANVLAMVPGSDPVLRNEVVVISAHNDHVGITGPDAQGRSTAVDHDSLRTARLALLKMQMQSGELVALPQGTTVNVNVDSLRRIRPARRDSIRNGADDDGSGSMALLEIAEAVMAMPVKPKRTILFAWWAAEEDGLVGSRFFSDNSTIPLAQIVANINLDMIGRGRAEDVPGGGPDYLGFLGANRLASVLEERVRQVNQKQNPPLKLDNRFDWPITWPGYNNIYGRSDHANFSRYSIPIVFFFTGLHADYHQVTDEPQYIDYPHYTRVVKLVNDLAIDVANLPNRPSVDRSGAIPPRPPRP